MVQVTFISPDGAERRTVDAPPGITLLKLAHFEGVDMEGTCGGQMACATCHVILGDAWIDAVPPPSDEELDMLALAPDVEPGSRLGCQIVVTEALDGLEARLGPC
ncbi:2Fe-2S ferredoxin [Rhodothalassium salexigens]|uniref:2Fe-2S iron-sulfur cluster-binding protein n=1 Tax=Rhodothalassium salexigens TaxID=1086 RepID=UPI00191207E8|nr:2Fe-2S iron-sulfur cluster-binding protein [Rhodothalassium salexigens]MBK5911621.1 2Fe-2S ferredoxin [Rhodothalassium salexigens]MBK5920914.1 2Fe-2S ferredoxin [Rhodothalassium salexigens]